jgi:TIGR03009 family protein
MKGNPMARSIPAAVVLCGLSLVAGIVRGQNTPSSWPQSNPIRPDAQPGATSPPTTTANNPLGNQYPAATQPNNPPDGRYPAAQGNSYPGAQGNSHPTQGNPADSRYPQAQPQRQPNQPVNPQNPTLERRTPLNGQPAAPPPPPFVLTPAQQAEIDQILDLWERKGRDVKTFDTKFVRWEYDLTLAAVNPNAPPGAQPTPINKEQGILKFAAPDKGLYHVIYTEKNGKWEPTPPDRVEHWMCDGNSIFEWKYPPPAGPNQPLQPGQVVEHQLPPNMKGKAIADGPLPFLFGAEADKLRARYWFKKIPAADPQKEVWLDAYPRFQQDAANFMHARVVLNLSDMTPKALQVIQPNGKNYYSYEFFDTVVNDRLRIFQGNPFQVFTPRGWQKVVNPPPNQNPPTEMPAQANRTVPPMQAGRTAPPTR